MSTEKPNGKGFNNLVRVTGYVLLLLLIAQYLHHYFVIYVDLVSQGSSGDIRDYSILSAGAVQVATTIGVVIVVSFMLPRGKKQVDDDNDKEPEPAPSDT